MFRIFSNGSRVLSGAQNSNKLLVPISSAIKWSWIQHNRNSEYTSKPMHESACIQLLAQIIKSSHIRSISGKDFLFCFVVKLTHAKNNKDIKRVLSYIDDIGVVINAQVVNVV